jgi:hypothetical protein
MKKLFGMVPSMGKIGSKANCSVPNSKKECGSLKVAERYIETPGQTRKERYVCLLHGLGMFPFFGSEMMMMADRDLGRTTAVEAVEKV